MLEEDFINVARVNVEPAGDNHIFLAVHNEEITVFISDGDVSGMEPAVFELSFRLGGIIPVPLHDQRSLHDDFTRLSVGNIRFSLVHIHQPHVVIRERNADAAHFLQSQNRIGDAQRRRFGKAVAFTEINAHILDLFDKFHGHRRSTRIQQAELFVQIHFGCFGMVDESGDQRGNRREKGDLIEFREKVHHLIDVEAGNLDLGSAVEQRPVHDDNVAVNMEIRQHGHDIAFFMGRERNRRVSPQRALKRSRNNIGVGENGAFGDAGCAAGKLNQGRVFGIDLDFYPFGIRMLGDEFRKVTPARLQIKALGGTHGESLDIVGDGGDDDAGNQNLLAQGSNGRESHIKGDQRGHARRVGHQLQFVGGV